MDRFGPVTRTKTSFKDFKSIAAQVRQSDGFDHFNTNVTKDKHRSKIEDYEIDTI